jgi:hypothetical protein
MVVVVGDAQASRKGFNMNEKSVWRPFFMLHRVLLIARSNEPEEIQRYNQIFWSSLLGQLKDVCVCGWLIRSEWLRSVCVAR